MKYLEEIFLHLQIRLTYVIQEGMRDSINPWLIYTEELCRHLGRQAGTLPTLPVLRRQRGGGGGRKSCPNPFHGVGLFPGLLMAGESCPDSIARE